MEVALTGATGFVGSHVLSELVGHGHEVIALVRDAVLEAYTGTGKPYVQIGGLRVYGDNTEITEDSPYAAPAMVAWKEPIQQRVPAGEGFRPTVLVSSVAYGDGGAASPARCSAPRATGTAT